MAESLPSHSIAIVGLAGRFPGARDLEEFQRNISAGVEIMETMSEADMDAVGLPKDLRANANFVPKFTTLENADLFAAEFFGMSPREAQTIDPQQRIFLECAWEALENAGYSPLGAEQAIGVYGGASMNTYTLSQLMRNPDFVKTVGGYQIMIGNDKDFLCTRVSYELGLHGPSLTIQTACSTSLVAVAVACQALSAGECDMALAGGVSVGFPQRAGYLYEEGMILSPDGHCRPFDIDARGTRAGAGCGIVVLKRFADAVADRDTIHAVIRGVAINNDGAGKAGYTAPSVNGQVEAIATALALAGVDARSISYVEAHGTGTPLGDPIEIAALTKVFRASTPDAGFCRIGSLKANIGHLDAAAGVAGLIKTVLALTHRELPPLVNFRKPNPQLDIEHSPFTASAESASWVSDGMPRRAGVSSFGIGGTNAHVVLEEAPPVPASKPCDDRAKLIILSAKTADGLDRATSNLADFLRKDKSQSLSNIEWTLQVGRQAFAHRRAVVVTNQSQTIDLLAHPERPPVQSAVHEGGARPIAFLFSGQGSQYVGMGAGLYETHSAFRASVDRCAVQLEPLLGLDIRKLMFTGNGDSAIDETRFAQPALFVVEYALACLWSSLGVKPAAMLGHSIGEYTAAHLAGVMSLEDALALVVARGRLMQSLPKGSMLAVHCAPEQLRNLLCENVEIAAINAPGLCVLSGSSDDVSEVMCRLDAKGIEYRPLRTSHAFHSRMMEPALGPFTDVVKQIKLKPPYIAYVSNVTGTWITPEQATSPAYYATHLRRTVQFEEGIRTIVKEPTTLLLEVGPGDALSSLARLTLDRKITKHIVSSLSHPQKKRADDEAIVDAAGRLWLAGVDLDWKNLHPGAERWRVPLPTYPFKRNRYWVDPSEPIASPRNAQVSSHSEDVGDWIFAPSWMREPSHNDRDADISGLWLVLGKNDALAKAVIDRLRKAGGDAVFVEFGENFKIGEFDQFQARLSRPQEILKIVRHLRDRSIRGVIYLGNRNDNDLDSALASYHALVALAEGLENSADTQPIRVVVVTFGVERVLDEPVRNPIGALVLGPVLVLPTELPYLQMRAVDLDLSAGAMFVESDAEAIVIEAGNPDQERMVAWRRGCRWMRRYERLPLPKPAKLPLKPHGVYLITGGLGGIGLTLARWFSANAPVRLMLTARTAVPEREHRDQWLAEHPSDDRTSAIIRNIREIEDRGSEVIVASADAANFTAMKATIDQLRGRWGRIDGVVHAAGIAGSGRIAFLKQQDDVQSVISPKVEGLRLLVQLLGETTLDFVALMSSINSVIGAPGICDYAAANAVLDAFPESEMRPAAWKNVVSIDWGPWRDLGMAAGLARSDGRATSEAYRRITIPPDSGAEIFARALAARNTRVVVVPYDLTQNSQPTSERIEGPIFVEKSISPQTTAPASATLDRPNVATAYVPLSTETEQRLAEIWAEVLGVKAIGANDNFFELGGHSLLATRVLARISASLRAQLGLRDVFDAPTLRELAEKISGAAVPDKAEMVSGGNREEIEF